jgi:pseudouridine-5'-phosphate glycosidase
MATLPFIQVNDEVADALSAGHPVVALETTLVTHGLPAGEGLDAAAALEASVRESGAVPATVGVLRGRVRVGLSRSELEELSHSGDVAKLNPGNLAAQVASGRPGSTTVAATITVAARTGIRVFATGGIGGVHRAADETGDVSADLFALARCQVAVVCSGAKAVLDLARTVEALESLGVPVLGYRTDTFPAFYRRSSGLAVDRRFERLEELAAAIRVHFDIIRTGGALVANPVPAEFEMAEEVYDRSLTRALADVEKAGVRGRAVTPFLLERMRQLTEGASVFSNRALLVNNAHLAGELAVAMGRQPHGSSA